jgi:hypothetical protein
MDIDKGEMVQAKGIENIFNEIIMEKFSSLAKEADISGSLDNQQTRPERAFKTY